MELRQVASMLGAAWLLAAPTPASGAELASLTTAEAPEAQVSKARALTGRKGRPCAGRKGKRGAARKRPCQRRRRPPAASQGQSTAGVPTPQAVPPSPSEAQVPPRCELVQGDCGIYSKAFWILQARYERFELETGVYPMSPECMEAQAEGQSVVCAQAIHYLYPDGTLGTEPWVLDPDAPGGWRRESPESERDR